MKAGVPPGVLNKHFGIPSLIVEINAKIPVWLQREQNEDVSPQKPQGDFYLLDRRITWEALFDRQEPGAAGRGMIPQSPQHWSLVLKRFFLFRCFLGSQDVTACTEQENSFSDPIVQITACIRLF